MVQVTKGNATPSTSADALATDQPVVDEWALFDSLVVSEAARREATRQAFLAEHPEWGTCAVPGCYGTVKPDRYPDGNYKYIREHMGVRTGFCPNQTVHAALKRERDAQANAAKKSRYTSR